MAHKEQRPTPDFGAPAPSTRHSKLLPADREIPAASDEARSRKLRLFCDEINVDEWVMRL
jgi:hypothetical protein